MNRMTKKVLSQGLFLFFFSLATTGWLAAQAGKTIDFSTLVVVGDSLAAGVQNGSLEDVQQLHGFANVIAQQLGTPLAPTPGSTIRFTMKAPGDIVIENVQLPKL